MIHCLASHPRLLTGLPVKWGMLCLKGPPSSGVVELHRVIVKSTLSALRRRAPLYVKDLSKILWLTGRRALSLLKLRKSNLMTSMVLQ